MLRENTTLRETTSKKRPLRKRDSERYDSEKGTIPKRKWFQKRDSKKTSKKILRKTVRRDFSENTTTKEIRFRKRNSAYHILKKRGPKKRLEKKIQERDDSEKDTPNRVRKDAPIKETTPTERRLRKKELLIKRSEESENEPPDKKSFEINAPKNSNRFEKEDPKKTFEKNI